MTRAGENKVGRRITRMRKLVCAKIPRRIPIASLRGRLKLKRRPTLMSIARRQERTLMSIAGRLERALTSTARRISIARRRSKVGRRMTETSMCDLPPKLVGEKILTRVPITSLRAVRSTCKLWESLTKDWILGKAAATRQQFLGFMTMNSKVCSIRFHLCRSKDKEEEDLLDLSVKQVDLLKQFEMSNVFHCDGLLLCVAEGMSRLMVWNPYLGQTKCIRSITEFHRDDIYAIGYDINRNHKILRYLADYYNRKHVSRYEIYDFSSNSWRLLDVTPDWDLDPHRANWSGGRGVSVKGNAYFFAVEHRSKFEPDADEYGVVGITDIEDFLMCFDFTTETFGPRLPLPFHSCLDGCVSLSCVRDEKLAVLHHNEAVNDVLFGTVDFWVTTSIHPNSVSWCKLLKVNMRPFALSGVVFDNNDGASFFIDEEEKVAVVFDIDSYRTLDHETRYHTAFISGQDGFFKPVTLGVAPRVGERCPITGRMPNRFCPPVVCYSSYLPSLVQLN